MAAVPAGPVPAAPRRSRAGRARRTRRGLLVPLLVLGCILAIVPAAAPAAATPDHYSPRSGPRFNLPTGAKQRQYAIFTHLNRSIASAPRGSTIRIAVYSFAEGRTADRLIAAHRRGVRVRMVFNTHNLFPAQTRLRRVLGHNRNRRSFVVECQDSCRGSRGNMHAKMFLFSRAGRSRSVVMTGSANLTRHNARDQWSDLYTARGDQVIYRTLVRVFGQMTRDRPVRDPYVARRSGALKVQVLPRADADRNRDPVGATLSAIGCRAARGYGYRGRTTVRISMHAWNGDRGRVLARKAVALRRSGCWVAAILGVGAGRAVKTILRRGDVSLSHGTVAGVRTHQKLLLVNGRVGRDRGARVVWTGSANWTDGSMRRDEVILRIARDTAFERYAANWWRIWRTG